MKKILFTLVLVLPFIFTGCSSDDDDDLDPVLVEGTWGLVHSEGFDYEDPTDPLDWDYDCNPLNPSSYDDEKFDIINTEGNKYYMENYYYSTYSKKWVKDDSYSVIIKGNTITPIIDDEDIDVIGIKILNLTSTSLTIEAKMGKIYYNKSIYKRLQ